MSRNYNFNLHKERKTPKIMEIKKEETPDLKLSDLLSKHNFTHIKKFSEIEELLDLKNLNQDGSPRIKKDIFSSLIVFDNENFNNATLIDSVNTALDNIFETGYCYGHKMFYYVDDFNIRCKLFQKDIDISKIENKRDFERTVLKSSLMTINYEKQEVNIFEEQLMVFTPEIVRMILKQTLFDNGKPKNKN